MILTDYLAQLEELRAWMRANGVQRVRHGDVELELGPAPSSPPGEATPEDRARREDADRAHMHRVLFASSSIRPMVKP